MIKTKISLLEFLRTGNFGELQSGLSAEHIRAILGEPDAIAGMSRKHPHPSVYLYGTLEIWFSQKPDYEMIGLFWEAGSKGEIQLPFQCTIVDWALTPGMYQAEVEGFLHTNDFLYERSSLLSTADTSMLILASGVHISFQHGKLYAVSSSRK